MEQSILNNVKKILNVDPDDTSFDVDIIIHTNTAFSHLQQLGIGPKVGFVISDDTLTWEDFLPVPTEESETYLPILSAVKTNIYLRVKAFFDPPTLSHVATAMQQQLEESDIRLNRLREATDWVSPDPVVVDDDT